MCLILWMISLSLLLVFLSSFVLNAQEHLLSLLQNDEEPVYSSYLFKGTKVVTGESVELVGKGVLQFIIQHLFKLYILFSIHLFFFIIFLSFFNHLHFFFAFF